MKLVLFLVTLYLISCNCEPDDAYCCKPGTSVMADDENVCVDLKNNNITTPMKLTCKNFTFVDDTELSYVITDDGRMVLFSLGMELHLNSDQFCVSNGSLNFNERFTVMCQEEEGEQILEESLVAYFLLASVVFLILTVIVYCALPEMRDLQGKSLINFCISLAMAYVMLSTSKLHLVHLIGCKAQGFLIYFFFISSFFWSNAISIQILLNIRRPIKADYGWKAFLWYALYAWGCPTVITVCMVIANSLPGYHHKPGIGLYMSCWFFSMRHQWQYMYSIMTILILANVCIFFYISTHLCRHSFASSHIKALKYKFVMTVRMFIVMALPWIFEMVSSLSGPHIIWVITDIFNMLQGLVIFLLLVVFRKRVIKAMFKRGWLDCISGFIERHLAVGEDDEEDVVPHTMDIGLQEGLTQ